MLQVDQIPDFLGQAQKPILAQVNFNEVSKGAEFRLEIKNIKRCIDVSW